MSEKLCLQWNDFKENVISSFESLREDQDFSDVTLACEDGQQIKAHRVILAGSSPFFENLLRSLKHSSHPLIYMRGVCLLPRLISQLDKPQFVASLSSHQ